MDWKTALAQLRAHLPPQTGSGPQRGSLRWLEAEMKARGGNPASLRNIVYRDVGTVTDKRLLSEVLHELADEAGISLTLQLPGQAAPLPAEMELLGRSKKRVYKQFLAAVRSGRSPRLAVSGRAGAGKTVLLDQLATALREAGVPVRRLNIQGDLLGQTPELRKMPDRSFASLAARQVEALRAVLPPADLGVGSVLLVRVTSSLHFAGDPPRLPDGTPTTPAAWTAEVLGRQLPPGVAALFALEDAQGWPAWAGEVTELQPPTLTEARAYLMAQLGVPRSVADQLARETGRHLDRLALLAGAGGDAAQLLADPDVRRLACAVSALTGMTPRSQGKDGAQPPVLPAAVLEAALGASVSALPLHVRSLLHAPEGDPETQTGAVTGWQPSAVLWQALPLLPPTEVQATARHFVQLTQKQTGLPELAAYRLAALTALGDWDALVRHLEAAPDDARFLPLLWKRIRDRATSPARETLARAVVTHHSGRGEYHAPAARDALFVLLESEGAAHAWARVKLAESSLDAGNFGAAQMQLDKAGLPQLAALARPDDWALAAQADGLLVQAALARWQGDLKGATAAVNDPRTARSGPRARLWRGLVAKDAGRWAEALDELAAVPQSSPLLSARALYQEGDLRLRLGQPGAALLSLTDAAQRLAQAGANAEEQARVLARAGTAQRRLGRPQAALHLFGQALDLLPPDPRPSADLVPRARLLSERLPVLLALGRTDEALAQAAETLLLLRQSGGRRAEIAYRVRRTHYRIALAYLTRGRGRPYLQPLGGPEQDHPDLVHARDLLNHLLQAEVGDSDREQVLTFDMQLSYALAQPDPRQALERLERALEMTDHPYTEAQARALRAEAYVRLGDPAAALGELGRTYALLRRVRQGLPGVGESEPGLVAQILAIEVWAELTENPARAPEVLTGLRQALDDPALHPFRRGIWYEAGRALESRHPAPREVLLALHPLAGELPLRVTDALAVLEVPPELSGSDTLSAGK